jgi:hypothetical protein
LKDRSNTLIALLSSTRLLSMVFPAGSKDGASTEAIAVKFATAAVAMERGELLAELPSGLALLGPELVGVMCRIADRLALLSCGMVPLA